MNYRIPKFTQILCAAAVAAGLGAFNAPPAVAAWYLDRDNKMEQAEPEVAKAMFMVHSKAGISQAIQVCEGVFLTTVIDVLKAPKNAGSDEGTEKTKSQRIKIYPYPVQRGKSLDAEIPAAQIDTLKVWEDPAKNYMFVKFGTKNSKALAQRRGFSYDPDAFVPLGFLAPKRVKPTAKPFVPIYMYRGQTRYKTDALGLPDFELRSFSKAFETYQTPLRVQQQCDVINSDKPEHIDHNCPAERFTFGSPMIAETRKGKFLVGINTRAPDGISASYAPGPKSNAALTTSSMCKDYWHVCGRLCEEIKGE